MTGAAADLWASHLDAVVATMLSGGVSAPEIRALLDDSIDRAEATR